MIQLSAARMQRAIAKARELKPLVRVLAFRCYTVTNKQTGSTYKVEFAKLHGKPFGSCSCEAGKKGLVCYHVASAASIHMQLAADRATLNF